MNENIRLLEGLLHEFKSPEGLVALKELEQELLTSEKNLTEVHRVLKAIPECRSHGELCVPHAVEWIERVKHFLKVMENG